MATDIKSCSTCRWWMVGFCSSIEVMQHLKEVEGGELKTFTLRAADDLPLLDKCWLRATRPETSHPGPRPPHKAPSTTPEISIKSDAFEAIKRSAKGEM